MSFHSAERIFFFCTVFLHSILLEDEGLVHVRICYQFLLIFYPKVHHYPKSGVWELRILVTDWLDRGEYWCKTNTEPSRKEAVIVSVEDTKARIEGPKERIVGEGSSLVLTCTVRIDQLGPNTHFRYAR